MGLRNILKNLLSSNTQNTTAISTDTNFSLSKNDLFVHPDLVDLIWIGDGKYKNFTKTSRSSSVHNFDGFSIKMSMFGPDEPSLLYLGLPIQKPLKTDSVERPPYYPFYSELSPKQKWMYWKFLSDPYNPQNDIGYVFIFYYGLERHLLHGNFEKAFELVLKLRDIYSNKSFQHYSSCALILSAMLHKRPEYAEKFINSLDKEYEFEIPADLYMLCKFGLNIPITAKDIMHCYKAFGFTNNRYIKNNPDLFLYFLQKNLEELTGGINTLFAGQFFSKADVSKLKSKNISIFANVSIMEKEIRIPDILQPSKFTSTIYMVLNQTHEDTKKELAKLRKQQKNSLVETEKPKN